MARTKRSRRSYGAGEWGRNRVRVFPDSKTGLYQLEWRENGRRLTRSLGHREWVKAKKQADEFAAGFAGPDPNGKAEAEPEPLTLGGLLDIYGEEVTPTKGAHTRGHDRAATHMFLRFFGRNRDPATLSQRDWDRFIRERRAGRIGPSGRRVSDGRSNTTSRFLVAVLNWAVRSRDERGRPLLDRNPLKGLRKPTEKNPTRVVLGEEEYRALLKVAPRVDWRFHVALVLAHETGHRIGAIRQLRWFDIDFEGGDDPLACRARQVGPRTRHAHHRRSALRTEGGAQEPPRNRGSAGATRAEESVGVSRRGSVARLVEQGPDSCGAGSDARQGLACAEAEVRQRPDGSAAQGALRLGRLEDRQDGARMLPATGCRTASEGSGSSSAVSRLRSPIGGSQLPGIGPVRLPSSIPATDCEHATSCRAGKAP